MLKCVNVMEQIVDSNIEEVMRKEQCCTCERCKMDVRALTLNRVPPKYVVTEAGMAFEECRQGYGQNWISVYQCMLEAIQKVKENPHHGDEPSALHYY